MQKGVDKMGQSIRLTRESNRKRAVFVISCTLNDPDPNPNPTRVLS